METIVELLERVIIGSLSQQFYKPDKKSYLTHKRGHQEKTTL